MSSKRIFIISGEPSGDLHAANLVKAWKKEAGSLEFEAWGGDRLKAEGVAIRKHVRDLSFMGFVEVIQNLPTILKNFKTCKEQILAFKTEVLLLVDYPGFNLRMAKWAKQQGITVIYYISPTIWAWKENRVEQIRKYVDRMYTILPFEKAFYAKHGIEVQYFGHPLLDEIHHFRSQNHPAIALTSTKPILALLPGSRKQELRKKLPLMLKAAMEFQDSHQIILACAPNLEDEFYWNFVRRYPIQLVKNQTYSLLSEANIALVTSGTATLETALFQVPQVVCYKSSALSYRIAKALVKIKFISLVNLIMDKEVVRELIQQDCNIELMKSELRKIMNGSFERLEQLENYTMLRHLLGEHGASERMAKDLQTYLS